MYKLELSARDALLVEEALKDKKEEIKRLHSFDSYDYNQDDDYNRVENLLLRLEKEIL